MRHHRFQKGFTFVELMAVLLVVGVVASMAIPSFLRMTQSNRAQSQSTMLLRSLTYARSEAVRRNASVHVTSLSGDKNWGTQGWRVWVDQDGDNAYTDGKDSDLQEQASLSGGATLVAADNSSEIIFSGNGFINRKLTDDPVVFNFRINSRCDLGRDITLMPAGRASIDPQGGC